MWRFVLLFRGVWHRVIIYKTSVWTLPPTVKSEICLALVTMHIFCSWSDYIPHTSPETRSSYFRCVGAEYVASRHRTAGPFHCAVFHLQLGALDAAVGRGTALKVGRFRIRFPDGVIEIFHWHDPSGDTMALTSAQPLTEISTRSISWG